jgi:hypothetical protein
MMRMEARTIATATRKPGCRKTERSSRTWPMQWLTPRRPGMFLVPWDWCAGQSHMEFAWLPTPTPVPSPQGGARRRHRFPAKIVEICSIRWRSKDPLPCGEGLGVGLARRLDTISHLERQEGGFAPFRVAIRRVFGRGPANRTGAPCSASSPGRPAGSSSHPCKPVLFHLFAAFPSHSRKTPLHANRNCAL